MFVCITDTRIVDIHQGRVCWLGPLTTYRNSENANSLGALPGTTHGTSVPTTLHTPPDRNARHTRHDQHADDDKKNSPTIHRRNPLHTVAGPVQGIPRGALRSVLNTSRRYRLTPTRHLWEPGAAIPTADTSHRSPSRPTPDRRRRLPSCNRTVRSRSSGRGSRASDGSRTSPD
jgi:hypothetical protein